MVAYLCAISAPCTVLCITGNRPQSLVPLLAVFLEFATRNHAANSSKRSIRSTATNYVIVDAMFKTGFTPDEIGKIGGGKLPAHIWRGRREVVQLDGKPPLRGNEAALLPRNRLFVIMNGVGSVVTVTPEAASMARARLRRCR
jgi:hypothetical protein